MEYLAGLLIIPLLFVGLVYLIGWANRTSCGEEWDSKQNGAD